MHPVFKDLGVTTLAQAAVALGSLALYRLLAVKTGTDGFASYSLVRQASGILFPVVTVGLVGGLPRYIALSRGKARPAAETYLVAGAAISGAATAIAAIVALAFPDATAALFFGDSDRSELVLPFVALLAATAIFYVAYGYFRGQLRLLEGSAIQVLGFALAPPLVVAAFADEGIRTIVLIVAAVLGLCSVAAVAAPLVRGLRLPRRRRLADAGRELWDYGHRRVPGELAQLGLFVLVPVLGAHVASLTDVAYLSAGQQVLSVFSLAVVPLGLVLLPSLARLWEDDRERASRHVGELSSLAVHVAVFVGIQALLYADIAVRAWLGSGFDDAGDVVRVTVVPGALFVVYLMLRSTLDAVTVRAYNSRNNIAALAVFGATAAVLLGLDLIRPVMAVAWAFAAGVTVQGLLTLLTVHRLFGLRLSDYSLGVALALGLAAGALGLAARPLIDGSGATLLFLTLLELVLGAAYFAALFGTNVGWSRLLRERFFFRQA